MRRIVISKNQLLIMIHEMVTIFQFVREVALFNFNENKLASVFKYYYAADVSLAVIVYLLHK